MATYIGARKATVYAASHSDGRHYMRLPLGLLFSAGLIHTALGEGYRELAYFEYYLHRHAQ